MFNVEEGMQDDDSDDEGMGADGDADAEGGTSPAAILCVDCSADNSLIASGCADSTAKIFNVTSGKVRLLFCLHCSCSFLVKSCFLSYLMIFFFICSFIFESQN